jgi:hypothetical protein
MIIILGNSIKEIFPNQEIEFDREVNHPNLTLIEEKNEDIETETDRVAPKKTWRKPATTTSGN